MFILDLVRVRIRGEIFRKGEERREERKEKGLGREKRRGGLGWVCLERRRVGFLEKEVGRVI